MPTVEVMSPLISRHALAKRPASRRKIRCPKTTVSVAIRLLDEVKREAIRNFLRGDNGPDEETG